MGSWSALSHVSPRHVHFIIKLKQLTSKGTILTSTNLLSNIAPQYRHMHVLSHTHMHIYLRQARSVRSKRQRKGELNSDFREDILACHRDREIVPDKGTNERKGSLSLKFVASAWNMKDPIISRECMMGMGC